MRLGVRVRSNRRFGRGQGSAQTGLCRKRHQRKQRVEARAASERRRFVNGALPRDVLPAGSSRRSRGLVGSSSAGLGEAIAAQERLTVDAEDRVEEERVKLAHFKELLVRRHELYEEQDRLRRERLQMEQKVRALEQRAEREQRRSECRAASVDGSRRGRAVRIVVDPDAWAAVKREAVRRRVWLVCWIGDLVRIEVDAFAAGEVSGQPSARRRRSPGEDDPQPREQFLRIDVDDDHWNDLRATSLDVGLTVGRYVGELAEAAAYETGWRSG